MLGGQLIFAHTKLKLCVFFFFIIQIDLTFAAFLDLPLLPDFYPIIQFAPIYSSPIFTIKFLISRLSLRSRPPCYTSPGGRRGAEATSCARAAEAMTWVPGCLVTHHHPGMGLNHTLTISTNYAITTITIPSPPVVQHTRTRARDPATPSNRHPHHHQPHRLPLQN